MRHHTDQKVSEGIKKTNVEKTAANNAKKRGRKISVIPLPRMLY